MQNIKSLIPCDPETVYAARVLQSDPEVGEYCLYHSPTPDAVDFTQAVADYSDEPSTADKAHILANLMKDNHPINLNVNDVVLLIAVAQPTEEDLP